MCWSGSVAQAEVDVWFVAICNRTTRSFLCSGNSCLHSVRGGGFCCPRGMRLPETERIHYILISKAYGQPLRSYYKAYGHSMPGDEIAERVQRCNRRSRNTRDKTRKMSGRVCIKKHNLQALSMINKTRLAPIRCCSIMLPSRSAKATVGTLQLALRLVRSVPYAISPVAST